MKFQNILFLLCINCIYTNGYANTVFKESVAWKNKPAVTHVLAKTPQWNKITFDKLFQYFKQSHKTKDAPSIEHNAEHVGFVNFNWGPKTNPFVKYQRPGRLFVFIGDHPKHGLPWYDTKDNYFVAPIFYSNNHYFVFEAGSDTPVPVYDWVNSIAKSAKKNEIVRINVCAAYATKPEDVCGKATYASEANFAVPEFDPDDGDYKRLGITPPSATRQNNQDWQMLAKPPISSTTDSTMMESAVAWADITARNQMLSTINTWPNKLMITNTFNSIRDLRYIYDHTDFHFLRRITWLLPAEGCWSRTAAFIKDFFGGINNPVMQHPRPSKIYAFGNLCVNSDYTPDGHVNWWYHVAPAIRNAQTNQTYILDPAVDATRPLTTDEWIGRITAKTGSCSAEPGSISKIYVCNGYGLHPWRSCHTASKHDEAFAMLVQIRLQRQEISDLEETGYNARELLGNSPPWKNTKPSNV